MKKIPMMLQLVCILFGVMAIPIAIVTWYSGGQILNHSKDTIAESSLAGLQANRKLGEMALHHIAQEAVRLATSNTFDAVRPYKSYEKLNANFDHVSDARQVLHQLVNLKQMVDGVYSSFFVLDDTDYVISTDKGIIKQVDYESLQWLDDALQTRKGISGVWYSRQLSQHTDVISYVLPLSRLSSTTRGTIVINMLESQMGQYLQTMEPGKQEYWLLQLDGTIISHHNKALLYTNAGELPHMDEILQSKAREGHMFRELAGEKLLYTWSRSDYFEWLNVNQYSVDTLMSQTSYLQRNIVVITSLIILGGSLLAVLAANWISRPVRKLVKVLRMKRNLDHIANNELVFLDNAFHRMEEEESLLRELLEEREQATYRLTVQRVLRGEIDEQAEHVFVYHKFTIVMLSIDSYKRYEQETKREARIYHRYQLIEQSEAILQTSLSQQSSEVILRCAYYGDGYFAIIINDHSTLSAATLEQALSMMQAQLNEWLHYSITIGISSSSTQLIEVPDLVAEALEVIKQRMIVGGGKLMSWQPLQAEQQKYIYPVNSEARLLNYLQNGDLQRILQELQTIRLQISEETNITYDNIIFIYNQLIGVTIKWLRESSTSANRVLANSKDIYVQLMTLDTLDELEQYIRQFYIDILQHMQQPTEKNDYGEQIIRYLHQHYRTDIIFENMASEIGISYSYMRKIVNEITGKSLIEYTNYLRIEKAKQLLLQTEETMHRIALQVGYQNVQSFNRFFRKFEGMPPSSYKMMQLQAQADVNTS